MYVYHQECLAYTPDAISYTVHVYTASQTETRTKLYRFGKLILTVLVLEELCRKLCYVSFPLSYSFRSKHSTQRLRDTVRIIL